MSSTTYRQLVLRLPDGLKETMRDRVAADASLDGVDFTPEKKGSRRCGVFSKAGTKYDLNSYISTCTYGMRWRREGCLLIYSK